VPEPERSEEVWSGRYLSVHVERWPGIGDYEIVRKHHAVGIVPVTPAGDVLLVRQFRPPVRTELLEIPAGLLDVEQEDAVSCAARELHEETGYRHATIEFMGGVYLSPGFTDEYFELFWAATQPEPEGEPEPGIELVPMPFDRAVAAARGGRFRNASTALALLLAAGRVSAP
jgi:8-oxo-dGTP pyrophosphatase MutT (NUDIX family)